MNSENSRDAALTAAMPLPVCIIDHDGKVVEASPLIGEVFLYDDIEGSDIFALTGVKYDKLVEAAGNGDQIVLPRSEKAFRLISAFYGEERDKLILYFLDITDEEALRTTLSEKQNCFVIVNIDNYDELIGETSEDNQAQLAATIDKEIRAWGATMKASVTKYRGNRFLLIAERMAIQEEEKKKFDILDKIRLIETEADFPVTLSIGVGISEGDPDERDRFADEALDVALGRGGDQAVVKIGSRLFYYGGKTQAVEKSNKGKSRIIGHALVRLIDNASRVVIMGHRMPDMDALGAAMGIHRLCRKRNKDAYIIINDYNQGVAAMYEQVKKSGFYEIINNHRADELVDDQTLLVVVDTHRPSITEYPELLPRVGRVVVIDHHRKSEEGITSPTLAYTEPYASSASELVTEILQYTLDKKDLSRLEAETLMAGISVDTNRFSVKTGVRTFEAAAWLKRAGADMAVVKRYFQVSRDTFMSRARCIAAAEFDDQGWAFSILEGVNENAQIVNSQVADELLTVSGVRASFVAGVNGCGRTVVSARSIGSLNVQVIMEKFGGGGHLNTAGAQMDISPEEAITKVKNILENMEA